MGYYFQDQLESGSWAGLRLNTQHQPARHLLPAERNLRAQQQVSGGADMGGSGGDPHRQLHKVRLTLSLLHTQSND